MTNPDYEPTTYPESEADLEPVAVAVVTLLSEPGENGERESILTLDARARARLVAEKTPAGDTYEAVKAHFEDELDFVIAAEGTWTFSIAGTLGQYSDLFGVHLARASSFPSLLPDPGTPAHDYWVPVDRNTDQPGGGVLSLPEDSPVAEFVDAITLDLPQMPSHHAAPDPAAYQVPSYPHLSLDDVAIQLRVDHAHATGERGSNAKVCVVDTGFFNWMHETRVWVDGTGANAQVEHEVIQLFAVYPHGRPDQIRPATAVGTTITLNPPVAPFTLLEVIYSAVHPWFSAVPGFEPPAIRAVAQPNMASMYTDHVGHGTLVSAELINVAPEVEFEVVAGWAYHTAFLLAFNTPRLPDVVSCSWGAAWVAADPVWSHNHYTALLAEIAQRSQDTVIVFAAGNAEMDLNTLTWQSTSDDVPPPGVGRRSVAPRDVITVGGAKETVYYPISGGIAAYSAGIEYLQTAGATVAIAPRVALRASRGATSFASAIDPPRHVPDVVGLVGEPPNFALTLLPTQPGSTTDVRAARAAEVGGSIGRIEADETSCRDGWAVTSGTSTATAEVAGVAALLKSQHPNLSPAAVHNILEESARDVLEGFSASAQYAGPGWDEATGHGLVDAMAALQWLATGFSPEVHVATHFIAASHPVVPLLADHVLETVASIELPPLMTKEQDIITRQQQVQSPEFDLGLTVKHRTDLSQEVRRGQENYIYVRLLNRGEDDGDISVALFGRDAAGALKLIGTVDVPYFKAGSFRVSPPITWASADLPAPGSSRLHAVLFPMGGAVPAAAAGIGREVVLVT